jgi:hypothetical protein
MMKRFAILSVIALCLAVVMPVASAQEKPDPHKDLINHGNLGLYFDLTRLSNTQLNMFGVGGRIGFNVHRHVVLEGEMAYDFEQSKTQSITSGGVTNTVRSNVRMLHFLFGPKIQTTGPVRFFALLKGGLVNFGVGGPVTAGAVNAQIGSIVDGNTDKAFYPGGGVELNRRKWGIRAEAGDEMIWFNDGVHHSLRVAFGPQIRF